VGAENGRLKKIPMKYRRMEYNAQLQARIQELTEALWEVRRLDKLCPETDGVDIQAVIEQVLGEVQDE